MKPHRQPEPSPFPPESGGSPACTDGTAADRQPGGIRSRREDDLYPGFADEACQFFHDAIWEWNLSSGEIAWNRGLKAVFGLPRAQSAQGMAWWTARIHPEDGERVFAELRRALEASEGWSCEFRFLRGDDRWVPVMIRCHVARDADGSPTRLIGGMSDLSRWKSHERDLSRLNRALQMLSACNEAVTRATEEQRLLEEVCRVAVHTGGYRLAWVGYPRNDDAQTIEPMASDGWNDGYLEAIRLSWSDAISEGRGPAGRTIRSGQTMVCRDLTSDADGFHWLQQALQRGYRGVICLPLREGEQTFGLLALYSAEPLHTADEEIPLLQQLADDLAFGIVTLRARLARQRAEEVVTKVAQAASATTGKEFFDALTRNLVEALGGYAAVIGTIDRDSLAVTTLSFVMGGKLQENVTYDLAGTPCENVTEGRMCVFERGVQESFPDDHLLVHYGVHAYAGIPLLHRDGTVAGILAVLFEAPLEETGMVKSTLRIFASRASAELDRQVSDARIREQASLLDRARDAIVLRELDHRVVYWNKAAERMYGWTAEEAAGRSVEELIYHDTSAFREACQTVVTKGEWLGDLHHFSKDGSELTVEGRWTLLRDDEGNPRQVLSINTDVTEHRRLEQQFLRAQRLESIGNLAGGIAHDLNNVLAPISMAIELLRPEVASERGRELLATLSSSARRGADMVGQVLSFARGMEGRRVEIQIRPLLADVENLVRETFPKNITLDLHVPHRLRAIQGDPTQLQQVLINLCVNARDAMPGGGTIRIQARDTEESPHCPDEPGGPRPCVRISVEDTGPGIPPGNLERIFEPFFTTKDVGKGTGLGLPTSLAILRSHGGHLRVESPPGRGARFDVILPGLPASSAPSPESPPATLPRGNGEVVLIADDEDHVRRVTARMLETFGYRPLLAHDGATAVELFLQHRDTISVVITDMMMPGMNGPSVIRALAAVDPGVRIIATSGVTSSIQDFRESGNAIRHFLPKPCSAETLLKVLRSVLEAP